MNFAEIELSVLSQQCLARRIPTVTQLSSELNSWQKERNRTASQVIWHFQTENARIKLKHLYPVFKEEKEVTPNAII